MLHTKWAKQKDLNYEKRVIEKSDKVVVVSDSIKQLLLNKSCLLYTSPSPRDRTRSRMPSSA